MFKKLIIVAIMLTLFGGSAMACGPAPSCWMEESPAYLKSVCQGYARDHKTAGDIRVYVEEPQLVPAFIKSCAKLRVFIN
jgi:hypothetical protein